MIHKGILSLTLSLLVFNACSKDDKDKVKEAIGGGDQQEGQQPFYTADVVTGKPYVLVYGDSLATGVLADTKLGENIDDSLALKLGGYVKDGTYSAANFQENMANPELAAATTDQSYGFRARAAASLGVTAKEVGVVSLAKFGGRSQDVKGMLARWQKEEESIKTKPNFVLVMLGGNDFCSDNTVEEISANFATEIEAVYRNSPGSAFVIAPSPPAPKIAAIDYTYGPALTEVSGEELTCKKFREQSCANVYLPDAQKRMDGINAGIYAAYQRIVSLGAKAVYVDDIESWDIQASDLSFDCFHPSAAGQEKIGSFISGAMESAGF